MRDMEERVKLAEDRVAELERQNKVVDLVLRGNPEKENKPGMIAIQARMLEDVYDKTMGLIPRMGRQEMWQAEVKAGWKGAGMAITVLTSSAVCGIFFGLLKLFKVI